MIVILMATKEISNRSLIATARRRVKELDKALGYTGTFLEIFPEARTHPVILVQRLDEVVRRKSVVIVSHSDLVWVWMSARIRRGVLPPDPEGAVLETVTPAGIECIPFGHDGRLQGCLPDLEARDIRGDLLFRD